MAPAQPSSFAVSAPQAVGGAVSPVVSLAVRILTFIFLLIAAIVLGTNKVTAANGFGGGVEIKFQDFYAFRYVLATAIIGILYTLLQAAFTIFHVSTGNRIGGEGLYQLDFYGDKAISYLLATGAAAGFGLAVDLNRLPGNDSPTKDFLDKANASASLVLMGFLLSAASSIFSSLSLPKRS